MQSSQNANFLFQSEKEKYILSGLETSLSELILSERNVSGVCLSCAALLGIPAAGGWCSSLSEAHMGPIACESITETLAPLQSVPSATSSRSVCSNSLHIAAPSNTSLEKICGGQPRGVRKAKYRVRWLHWGPGCGVRTQLLPWHDLWTEFHT